MSEIYIEFFKCFNEILANYFLVWLLMLVKPINMILFEESIYLTIMSNWPKRLISGVEFTETHKYFDFI